MGPQSNMRSLGRRFGTEICWIVGILWIHPSHPRFYLSKTGIHPGYPYRANGAPVPVYRLNRYGNIFPKHHVGQRRLRCHAKILALLWRIDLCKTDIGLFVVGVKHGNGVAISDTNYAPRDRICRRM